MKPVYEKRRGIKPSRKLRNGYPFAIIIALALIVGGLLLFMATKAPAERPLGEGASQTKFSLLSKANTNQCTGANYIEFKAGDATLQGSCCSPMDFHRYSEQVEGLKKYSAIDKIPPDPYDIRVSLAKELLGYKTNIKLSAREQFVYDEAVKLSHEGGPCCCKCWRWDAFEGQAKYLITKHGFNARQVAEVWDLEDGCGGEGHAGENA